MKIRIQSNQPKLENLDKILTIVAIVCLVIIASLLIKQAVDAYIEARIDLFFHQNNVWYLLEEIY